jgi:hypothetical protein
MRLAVVCLVASVVLPSLSWAQAPAFVITPEDSSIKFFVKSSVNLEGDFEKWDATLTFTSPDCLARQHLHGRNERHGDLASSDGQPARCYELCAADDS